MSFSPRLFAEFTLLMVNVGIGKQDEVAKWPEETALRSDVQLNVFDFPDEGRLRDLLGTGEEVLEHQEQPGGLQPPCGVRGGIRGGVQACRPRAQPPQSLQTGGGQAAGAEIQRDIVSMLGKAREQRVVKVLCDLVQRVRLTASTCLRPLLASRSGRSRSPSGHQGEADSGKAHLGAKFPSCLATATTGGRVGKEDSIAAGAQLDDDHTRNVSGVPGGQDVADMSSPPGTLNHGSPSGRNADAPSPAASSPPASRSAPVWS